jgi:hypothetical protein
MKRSYLQRRTPLKATKGLARRSKLRSTGVKRKKVVPVSKLKKQLWQLCRQIIFKKYGDNCYTCPAVELTGSNRHLGHFISKSVCSAALAYSLDNLRPQCYRCNIHLSGNWPSYEAHLMLDGIDVEALKQRNRDTSGLKYDVLFYQGKINEYTELLASENK